ncbi:hypothetical protein HYX17_04605 [Candidatus Woesearchaeota archaeon]|nr:hypothetical protein [Candidatus Woesearchaeota archaeon]
MVFMTIRGVNIDIIVPVHADWRGPTYELFKGDKYEQITTYKRNMGGVFGKHFHKGDDISKNPETLIVLAGRLEFIAYNRFGEKMSEFLEGNCESLPKITISPEVIHTVVPRGSGLIILEPRSLFNPIHLDTYPESEYVNHIRKKYG